MRLLVGVLLVGCNSSTEAPATAETPGKSNPTDKLAGSLTVGDAAAKLVACKPGHRERVFLDVVTSLGKLRFENMNLYWTPTADSPDRGVQLECKRLDRSWGGGIRSDGSAYWRGTLDFTCTNGATAVAGKLDLDCGMITMEERAQLDQNRTQMKNDQKM